jgi:hypothetical protein
MRVSSREDYMLEWCERDDFRSLLPVLLEGEDPQFGAYIRDLASRQPRRPQSVAGRLQ